MRKALRIVTGWKSITFRVVGDPHIDAPSHNRKLFIRDMERAKKNGESVIILGDIWSLILPKDLKRRSASHAMTVDAEIDMKIDQAFELLKPYVNCIDVIMLGNHETSVVKYHATDPVRTLIKLLNAEKTDGVFEDKRIQHGGYTFWLQVQFKNGRKSTSKKGWFHHGKGGASPVTKGIISGARIKVARLFDFGFVGHTHTNVDDIDTVEYMDDYGNVKRKDRVFGIVGGYSGEDVPQNPMKTGYMLDYSDEQHYGNESQGSLVLQMTPGFIEGDTPWVEMEIRRSTGR